MGVFSLVLHTHLPYVRRNGVWPSGEDFFHQAATESYLPMLETIERIAEGHADGPVLTVGITPLIAHQMEDPYMLRELALYLGRYDLRALWQVANYDGVYTEEFKDIAGFYARFARRQLARLESLPGGIARAFGALERAGAIEIAGGPASHPVLPEIGEPAVMRAQVFHGIAEHERHFGHKPKAMWMPECAYRPALGIEELLAEAGITHVVVDGPTMLRSDGPGATFAPRRIGATDVAAFSRNLDVTYRVWSPTGGYPGNKWYREYFAYDMTAGFKNWRVTSTKTPIAGKKPYDPARAIERTEKDAADFVQLLDDSLTAHEERTGSEGVVVACYDTELFGHWWFEGPAFLQNVYAMLENHPRVRAMSLGRALEAVTPSRSVELQEGSWGFRKDLRSWIAPETEEMWRLLAEAESETIRIARKYTDPDAAQERALAQLVRELFLLQSSDWPFMVLRGKNAGYARERFDGHRERWGRLVEALLRRTPAGPLDRLTGELAELDNTFPELGYKLLIS
ncbi:MAG: 1,4-alpha-glucan branching protein domain-containing protein [Actinomycetota bacterium]